MEREANNARLTLGSLFDGIADYIAQNACYGALDIMKKRLDEIGTE